MRATIQIYKNIYYNNLIRNLMLQSLQKIELNSSYTLTSMNEDRSE